VAKRSVLNERSCGRVLDPWGPPRSPRISLLTLRFLGLTGWPLLTAPLIALSKLDHFQTDQTRHSDLDGSARVLRRACGSATASDKTERETQLVKRTPNTKNDGNDIIPDHV